MKFYVGDKFSGMYIKGQIVKEYRDSGNIITLNKVRHILREKEEGSDFVWNVESKLDKKIRLRECKDGWYLYLPEPNVKVKINKKEHSVPDDELVNTIHIITDMLLKDGCIMKQTFLPVSKNLEKLSEGITDIFTVLASSKPRSPDVRKNARIEMQNSTGGQICQKALSR